MPVLLQSTAQMAPLDQVMKLKDEFKYRVVVEESLSLGVLGATGRGISEHFGIPVSACLLWEPILHN